MDNEITNALKDIHKALKILITIFWFSIGFLIIAYILSTMWGPSIFFIFLFVIILFIVGYATRHLWWSSLQEALNDKPKYFK